MSNKNNEGSSIIRVFSLVLSQQIQLVDNPRRPHLSPSYQVFLSITLNYLVIQLSSKAVTAGTVLRRRQRAQVSVATQYLTAESNIPSLTIKP